jgi:hypothetical protein
MTVPELAEQERRFAIVDAIPSELHPKAAQLVTYYRDMAPGPGLLPGRQHFDPMTIPALLPHLWLVDVVFDDPRRYRVRLIGSGVVASGATVRAGQFYSDAVTETDARRTTALFERIRQSRRIDWRRGPPMQTHYADICALERVILPMAADGHEVNLLLCMTLFYWRDGRVR